MSNTNAPFGFRPIGRMDGGSPTAGLTVAYCAFDATSMFAGDPVIPNNSGQIQIATASTVQIFGIFWGCEYLSSAIGRNVWSQYYPSSGQASGSVKCYIITDPDQLFVAQSDGTAIATTDVNANIQFTAGAGNTTTQQSTASLHQATITTTDTLPFRIVDLWSNYAPPGSPGTDNTSSYNWVVVAPNNWSRKQLTSVG